MKNFVQNGKILDIILAAAAVSGVPFLAGVILVVPQTSGAIGETVACGVNGVFDLPKATGQVWAIGALLYWDDAAKKVTTTSAGNTLVGYVAKPGLSGDTTGWVKLDR